MKNVSSSFCVQVTSSALLFGAWWLAGMVENGKIWGHCSQTKAGEFLEYLASSGNHLCLSIAFAFANSPSFQKGLTVAERDKENF